jgi:alpha-beta hydrolase superfamily lysophospholipase
MLKAIGIAVAAAAACTWLTLCLLFWQGGWQLLYHPTAAVTRTPAKNIALPFDSIGFAATAAGTPRLHGWWISAGPDSRFTVIYLHGADGNIGDSVESFIPLHAAKLNIFTFDYRGYGESVFERPTEAHWREDANSAIDYLVNTRHIAPNSLLLYGQGLGANLALEVAASHPELAGVILDGPLDAPMNAIFNDSRAKLVPAHLLVRDRWDASEAASHVLIPSLWFVRTPANAQPRPALEGAYRLLTARKEQVWLANSPDMIQKYQPALQTWLDDLQSRQ